MKCLLFPSAFKNSLFESQPQDYASDVQKVNIARTYLTFLTPVV